MTEMFHDPERKKAVAHRMIDMLGEQKYTGPLVIQFKDGEVKGGEHKNFF